MHACTSMPVEHMDRSSPLERARNHHMITILRLYTAAADQCTNKYGQITVPLEHSVVPMSCLEQ